MQQARPSAANALRLTTMQECLETLRDDRLHPEEYAPEAPFRAGTLIKLHGQEHVRRRRILNPLFSSRARKRWRDQVLIPTLQAELARALRDRQGRGSVRLDLVTFATRVYNIAASALTGLDADTDDERDLLCDLIEPLNRGGDSLRWARDADRLRAAGLAALATFKERFFEPSLRRRRVLLAQVASGERAEDEAPNDMMMLVARGADPAWKDEGNALRNVMQFMLGASQTNVHPLCYAVDRLEQWLADHPDEGERRTDPHFLKGVAYEALRLHTIGPALFRVASEDVTLPSGARIAAGQTVSIEIAQADRDTHAYGPTAAQFDPHRVVTGSTYPYGLAFGSGAHMCQGMPLVIGAEGTDGALVHVLKTLLDAGLRRDDSAPPTRLDGFRDTYVSYPVVFAAAPRPAKASAVPA